MASRCHQTPPAKYARKGLTKRSDYADPACYRYPIDSPEHIRAARSYFSRYEGDYPPKEREEIRRRIDEASKKHGIGPYHTPPESPRMATKKKSSGKRKNPKRVAAGKKGAAARKRNQRKRSRNPAVAAPAANPRRRRARRARNPHAPKGSEARRAAARKAAQRRRENREKEYQCEAVSRRKESRAKRRAAAAKRRSRRRNPTPAANPVRRRRRRNGASAAPAANPRRRRHRRRNMTKANPRRRRHHRRHNPAGMHRYMHNPTMSIGTTVAYVAFLALGYTGSELAYRYYVTMTGPGSGNTNPSYGADAAARIQVAPSATGYAVLGGIALGSGVVAGVLAKRSPLAAGLAASLAVGAGINAFGKFANYYLMPLIFPVSGTGNSLGDRLYPFEQQSTQTGLQNAITNETTAGALSSMYPEITGAAPSGTTATASTTSTSTTGTSTTGTSGIRSAVQAHGHEHGAANPHPGVGAGVGCPGGCGGASGGKPCSGCAQKKDIDFSAMNFYAPAGAFDYDADQDMYFTQSGAPMGVGIKQRAAEEQNRRAAQGVSNGFGPSSMCFCGGSNASDWLESIGPGGTCKKCGKNKIPPGMVGVTDANGNLQGVVNQAAVNLIGAAQPNPAAVTATPAPTAQSAGVSAQPVAPPAQPTPAALPPANDRREILREVGDPSRILAARDRAAVEERPNFSRSRGGATPKPIRTFGNN